MKCTNCLKFELPECTDTITLNTSFEANTYYYLHICNRDIIHTAKVISDDAGKIVLQLNGNPDIPTAYFNRYNGFYEVRITKENTLYNFLPFELCDGTSNECLLLTFKNCTGEPPAAVIPCNCPE